MVLANDSLANSPLKCQLDLLRSLRLQNLAPASISDTQRLVALDQKIGFGPLAAEALLMSSD